jgi:uncharacterized protein
MEAHIEPWSPNPAPASPRVTSPHTGGDTLSDTIAFLTVVAALATGLALALPGSEAEPGPVTLITLLVPAFAATAVRIMFRRRAGWSAPPIGLRRPAWQAWPIAASLAAVAITSSYAIAWAVGVADFHELDAYAAAAPIQIAVLSVLLLGEELGWRGYFFPRLEPAVGPRRAAIATGIAHGAFHVPLLTLTSAYDSAGSRWVVVPGVVTVVTLGGVAFGWLRHRFGSLWPVLIAHATVNVCLISQPELVTSRPDLTAALTGEGGMLTVVTVGIVAWGVHRHGDWGVGCRTRRSR